MGVAALSTSAISLTASPAPAPAAPSSAGSALGFAKLIARAKHDDNQQQNDEQAGSSTGTDIEVSKQDDRAVTAPEASEDAMSTTLGEQPVDLLAEIEAMVSAAGQLGLSQPVATPTPVAVAVTVATPPTANAVILPALAAKSDIVPMATIAAPVAAWVAPALDLPVDAVPAENALPAAAAAASAAPADPIATPRPDAAQKPAAGIATLLVSLKSAFQPDEIPADSVLEQLGVPAAKPADTAIAQVLKVAAATATGTGTGTGTIAPEAPSVDPTKTTVVAPTTPAVAPAPNTAAAPIIAGIETADAAPALAPEAVNAKRQTVRSPEAAIADAPQAKVAPAEVAPVEAAPLADAAPVAANKAPAAEETAEAAPAIGLPTAPSAPLTAAVVATITPSSAEAPAETAAIDAPSHADQVVHRELDVIRNHQWIDQIARDISQAANREGHIKFQLNPEHLGALTVEIANNAAGTAIKLTAETDQARAIIADAQPRLLAEVRAQGLRVSESHVELNNQQQQQQGSDSGSPSAYGQQNQQNRQASENSKPFERTQTVNRDEGTDSAPRDGELYA